jgi:hypothetical protein
MMIPVVCSIIVGYIFYGLGVFDRYHGSFQFVMSAIVASVFYYLLVYLRVRDAWLGLILLTFATLLTTESTRPSYILRDIFYVAAIGSAVFIYHTEFSQYAGHNRAFPAIILGGLYGILSVIASEIHLWFIRTFAMEDTGGTLVGLAATTAFFGLLIGVAVGAGITLADELLGRTKRSSSFPRAGSVT